MLEEFRGENIPVPQENEKDFALGLVYGYSEELWQVFQTKGQGYISHAVNNLDYGQTSLCS